MFVNIVNTKIRQITYRVIGKYKKANCDADIFVKIINDPCKSLCLSTLQCFILIKRDDSISYQDKLSALIFRSAIQFIKLLSTPRS